MKPEVKYGVFCGIGVGLWVVVEYLLGFHNKHIEIGRYSGYFSSIIPIVLIYLALRERRRLWHHGSLTFRQGFQYGVILSLISAVIITGFFWVYNHAINPGWLDAAADFQRRKMLQAGAGAAEIRRQLDELQKYSSPMYQLVWNFIGTAGLGLLFTVIISLFMKKKPAEAATE